MSQESITPKVYRLVLALPIITADAEGIVTYYNAAAQQFFGYQPDEIIGKPIHKLFPGGITLYLQLREVLKKREGVSLFELEVLGKKKRASIVRLYASSLKCDDGLCNCFIGIFRALQCRESGATSRSGEGPGVNRSLQPAASVVRMESGPKIFANPEPQDTEVPESERDLEYRLKILLPDYSNSEEWDRISEMNRCKEYFNGYQIHLITKDGGVLDVIFEPKVA